MAAKEKKSEQLSGFVVIFGEDPFLVSRQYEKIIHDLLTPEERGMALYEPRADEARLSDVLDELRTVPFLASKRVVVLKDAEPFIKDNAEALEKYLENPSPTGTLILTVSSWDKRLRFSKKVQSSGGLIEVGSFKQHELPGFITSYAGQTHGIKLDFSCARMLVDLTGDDPGRLCREMDKLAIYVSPRKAVTLKEIEALIGHNRMFGAFEVIDSIVGGNAGPAIQRLGNMFESDKDADYTVVGAFGYHFRKLFRAKALITKGVSPAQAAERCGAKFKQREFLQQAACLSLEQIGGVLAELGRIDFGIKNGQTTAAVSMERLIANLFLMQKKR